MRISDLIQTFLTEYEQPVSTFEAKTDSILPLAKEETIEIYDSFVKEISPKGTTNQNVLLGAPKPDINIAGEDKKAGIVVDISTNVLYTYDSEGNPTKAYAIASGKKSTPTERGIRIVTHKETYPYRGAPASSKRRRAPKDYGPFIVCLNKIDPKTGAQSSTGEFIHGCRSYHDTFETNPKRYVSHGCIRMENEAIVEVKEVKPGTIVIIK